MLQRFRARWRNLPPSMRGVVWALASGFMFSLMSLLIKMLTEDKTLHPLQVAWFRAIFGLITLLPFVVRSWRTATRTKRLGSHFIRALFGASSMMLGFYSVAYLPLATATALGFSRPLFMVPLAIVFLKEVVRLRRWVATIVGFLGVLVIVRPDSGIEFAAVFGVGSALAAALSQLMTKKLAATEPVPEMMFFAAVFTSLLTLVPALFVWQTPSWEQLALITAMGVVGSIGQLWLIWSLSEGDATLTGPMEYVRIIFAAGFGFLIFSEVPTMWTGIGSLIIVSSTVYIAWREAVLGKKRVASDAHH